MRTLNLGIVAHVDAGKTTLTERLLYAAGILDEVGSVDRGTTQTDFLDLERQRGITIKSAVVSFPLGGVSVNLIDTPGHPEFIAEVERVLNVLDGAVLVISAVEGVQAQTRVLMRTLQRLGIPTLIFVNKVDRRGARFDAVMDDISGKLTPGVIAMGSVRGLGSRTSEFRVHGAGDGAFVSELADLLAERDDSVLVAYVEAGKRPSYQRLRRELAKQTHRTLVHPVFFGSAITGAGVDDLIAGIEELLPSIDGDVHAPASGAVFKVDRGPAGEKIAYVRMFRGELRVRDLVHFGEEHAAKVTAISVFDRGSTVPSSSVGAGQIGKLSGLRDIRVGDAIGEAGGSPEHHHFAPPTLETVVAPRRTADKGALFVALTQLAEQDPLINLRQLESRELFVSLYGEVQKEVIQATLANDFGIDVAFRESTPICIERPIRTGTALEILGKGTNPFLATVGLRIEPAPIGSGVELRLDVKVEDIPLFIYKAVPEFHAALEEAVRGAFHQGLSGWEVTDCVVTLTHSGYQSPGTTARDVRVLTPLVLMRALTQARTAVCEPVDRFTLDIPADTIGHMLPVLGRLGAAPGAPAMRGTSCMLEGEIAASRVHDLHRQVPGLTRGEGVLEWEFGRYRPVSGTAPTRPRPKHHPLNRKAYLLHVTRRV